MWWLVASHFLHISHFHSDSDLASGASLSMGRAFGAPFFQCCSYWSSLKWKKIYTVLMDFKTKHNKTAVATQSLYWPCVTRPNADMNCVNHPFHCHYTNVDARLIVNGGVSWPKIVFWWWFLVSDGQFLCSMVNISVSMKNPGVFIVNFCVKWRMLVSHGKCCCLDGECWCLLVVWEVLWWWLMSDGKFWWLMVDVGVFSSIDVWWWMMVFIGWCENFGGEDQCLMESVGVCWC